MVDAARRDAVFAYARAGEPDDAHEFFDDAFGPDGKWTTLLAEEYKKLGNVDACSTLATEVHCD